MTQIADVEEDDDWDAEMDTDDDDDSHYNGDDDEKGVVTISLRDVFHSPALRSRLFLFMHQAMYTSSKVGSLQAEVVIIRSGMQASATPAERLDICDSLEDLDVLDANNVRAIVPATPSRQAAEKITLMTFRDLEPGFTLAGYTPANASIYTVTDGPQSIRRDSWVSDWVPTLT
jgi:hypothetical protein